MVFGIGLTVGRTPDAHGQIVQMILNEGGTLVDEAGAPAIDNPGTVAALERMKRWWDNGLIPENSASWDDSGNNTAYNSGQAAFVFNPASIFAYLEENDPELLADTTQAPFPAGPAGNFPSVGTWSWSIFADSPNIDAAKADDHRHHAAGDGAGRLRGGRRPLVPGLPGSVAGPLLAGAPLLRRLPADHRERAARSGTRRKRHRCC